LVIGFNVDAVCSDIVVLVLGALLLSSKLSNKYVMLFSDSSLLNSICFVVIESVIASTASIGISSKII